MTWQEIYTKTYTTAGLNSTDDLTQIKQDLNIGNRRFNAALGNYFNRRSKSTSLVADQQYYQLPPDCIRVTGVDFLLSSSRRLPLEQIRSEHQWRLLNSTQQGGNYITYWFQKGADEVGLFPTPTSATSNGLIIYYEPRGFNLSQDDYTTGTVEVTQGSATVTGTGTAFTNTMIGREFKVTDGSDGYTYRIAGYTSGTVLTLEEPFIGVSGAGKSYKIGEAPVFPDEYHDAPMDYALSRFFQLNNNPERARYHMSANFKNPGLWESAILDAQDKYASSSSSQVILDESFGFNPWLDNTRTISES